MTPINAWAQRNGISTAALADLRSVLDSATLITAEGATGSEAAAQQRIRLAAPKHGVRLWRNNVGACVDDRGNHIRYGLANESRAMNQAIKSSDLIGITPVTIKPEHVGATLGIFTAIECKRPGWKYKGASREAAQLSFINNVVDMGGLAQFATDPWDIWS